MTARQPPPIAPCPCGNDRISVAHWLREWNVFCGVCDRRGAAKKSKRAAVESWNEDFGHLRAPVDIEAAERRGAMAAVEWLERRELEQCALLLRRAIERGEVLPKRKARKRGGR